MLHTARPLAAWKANAVRDAPVPATKFEIEPRRISLDRSPLPAGRYTLLLRVMLQGEAPAAVAREIDIVR